LSASSALRLFENRVLRRIFGPKRDEVTEGWRKLHNEELHGLYSSLNTFMMIKSRRVRWVEHVSRMGDMTNVNKILVVNLEGKRLLGRPGRRWQDNIKMYFWEMGLECMDWIHLAQDRDRWRALVNTITKNVGSIKGREFLAS
jgi:hypothetical protein